MGVTVQTVRGPISSDMLGVTLPHEHILDRRAAALAPPLNPADTAAVELRLWGR